MFTQRNDMNNKHYMAGGMPSKPIPAKSLLVQIKEYIQYLWLCVQEFFYHV